MSQANKQQYSIGMIMDIVDKCGGFTSDAVTGRYIVGIENLYTGGSRYNASIAIVPYAYDREAQYGIWKDPETGLIYVDMVQGFDDFEQAKQVAIDNNEIALYDSVDCVTINLKDVA